MSETQTTQSDVVLTLLRRLSPREQLWVIAQVLPEVERELEDMPISSPLAESSMQADAEAALERDLLSMGLLTEIPAPLSPNEQVLWDPVVIPGMPLSEIIIAERR